MDLFEKVIGDPVIITERNSIVDVDLSSNGVDVDRLCGWPHFPAIMVDFPAGFADRCLSGSSKLGEELLLVASLCRQGVGIEGF